MYYPYTTPHTLGSNFADFPVTNAVLPLERTIAKPCCSTEYDTSITDSNSPRG